MTWKSLPKDPSPPPRPLQGGYGTKGRPIKLTTNHFPVTVGNINLVIYHYDVSIKDFENKEISPPLPKRKNMDIFEKMKESFPKVFDKAPIGYDSVKNAYSTTNIPQLKKGFTYKVTLAPEEGRKNKSDYQVTMVKVNQASVKELFECFKSMGKKKELPTTIMQMMEVMFRHYRAKKYIQVSGRNFFSINEEFARANQIGGGKEGVTGFFASLRPAGWKDGSILLNVDMAHTAFYKEQSVEDFIKEEFQGMCDFNKPLNHVEVKRLTKSLKGLKIKVRHALRSYKINSLTTEGAKTLKFELEDKKGKKKITVQNYMKEQYNIVLKYPYFNCINAGNQHKDIYLPMELCRIDKGQKVKKKLTDKEVSVFIRSTAVPPRERLQQIKDVVKGNDFKNDRMLKALTFTISDMPHQTTGRILPPPNLTMSRNENVIPRDGVWDIRRKGFYNAARLEVWAVINYDNRTDERTVRNFINRLVNMGKEKGMVMNHPFDIYTHRGREVNPLEDLQYYKRDKPDLQMVMCVLPGRKYYGAIKKAGDTEVQIMTQCVLGTNVFKCQDQTVGNILLKINAKMGGVNNILGVHPDSRTGVLHFKEPFLIMGADVNHPPAGGASTMPSIAAVVGSYDIHATKYAVERRAQYHRVEIIVDLQEITKNLLKNFYMRTKFKPNRIIMFRDGVSESQFTEVLSKEMKAMRDACSSLHKDYKPGITFICVQKRHHTRLFCDERDGIGRSKNVPPGTIVDREITHPTETDFFLCSHQGIQGTSKPTHYHLLWDDNDLPIDELQEMTYRLCHVYSRCARAVSIPTPVYYAHHAAFRAKVYIGEILGEESENGSIVSGASDKEEVDKQRLYIQKTARVTTEEILSSRLHYI